MIIIAEKYNTPLDTVIQFKFLYEFCRCRLCEDEFYNIFKLHDKDALNLKFNDTQFKEMLAFYLKQSAYERGGDKWIN